MGWGQPTLGVRRDGPAKRTDLHRQRGQLLRPGVRQELPLHGAGDQLLHRGEHADGLHGRVLRDQCVCGQGAESATASGHAVPVQCLGHDATGTQITPGTYYAHINRSQLSPIVPTTYASCVHSSHLSIFFHPTSRHHQPLSLSYSPQITIRWLAPIDNGGAPISKYTVYLALPGSNSYSQTVVALPTNPATALSRANTPDLVLEYTTPVLTLGAVYRFYLTATNAQGTSAASPLLAVAAGTPPGMNATQHNVYDSVKPTVVAVSASEIVLSWPMVTAGTGGGNPPTGYQVYMFSGTPRPALPCPALPCPCPALLGALYAPLYVATQLTRLFIRIHGVVAAPVLSLTSLPSPPLPSNPSHPTLSTLPTPPTPALVPSPPTPPLSPPGVAINTLASPNTVFKEVQVISTNSSSTSTPLAGSFALSWMGAMTVDLPFDASSHEVKIALQDLPDIGIVTVNREDHPSKMAYSWTVTFDSVPGDVEMIKVYPGRLTPLSNGASMGVVEKVAGSAARLVYDGRSAPEVRRVTVSNLNSDMTFSFKVG